MTNEPTLERIWEARRRIFAQCGNDPLRLVAHFMERQLQNPQRLLRQTVNIEDWPAETVEENFSAAGVLTKTAS